MKNSKKIASFILASSILIPSCALASGSTTEALQPTATQGTLDALQDQIAILTAQEKIAGLKEQIKTDDKGANATSSEPPSPYQSLPVPGLTPSLSPASSPAHPQESMPVIVSIQGRGDKLAATLLLPSGAQIIATPGADIGDGLLVHDVSENGVNVIQAGNLVPLQFEGAASAAVSRQ